MTGVDVTGLRGREIFDFRPQPFMQPSLPRRAERLAAWTQVPSRLRFNRVTDFRDTQLPTPIMAHCSCPPTVAGDPCVRRCAWSHEYFDPTGFRGHRRWFGLIATEPKERHKSAKRKRIHTP